MKNFVKNFGLFNLFAFLYMWGKIKNKEFVSNKDDSFVLLILAECANNSAKFHNCWWIPGLWESNFYAIKNILLIKLLELCSSETNLKVYKRKLICVNTKTHVEYSTGELVFDDAEYGVTSFHLPPNLSEDHPLRYENINVEEVKTPWHGIFRQGSVYSLINSNFEGLGFISVTSRYPNPETVESANKILAYLKQNY